MKKIENTKGIKTLDSEIAIVQMEKFTNNFDGSMKKENRRAVRTLLTILPSMLIGVGIMLAFPSPITFAICVAVVTGTVTVNHVIENKSMFRKMDKQFEREYGNITKISPKEEKDVEQVLEEGIGKSKDEDYYTEKYKAAVERVETDSERKYREALGKQNQSNPHLELADSKQNFLNKDEVEMQVVKEMDAYCVAYNLPPLTIANNDWDSFFDILYRAFAEKGIEDKFYSSMSEIGRFTFAKALVNKTKTIKINDFIDNLYYLQGGYGTYGCGIDKREILTIQKEIISKLQTQKVINFEDYAGEKSSKK